MSKTNDGGPAFPVVAGSGYYDSEEEDAILLDGYPGMSLRQYYAGQAMVGILSKFGDAYTGLNRGTGPADVAKFCTVQADALIAELEKGSE